jgi:hypothetical protein
MAAWCNVKATSALDEDAQMQAHLKSMETSGFHYELGVWSYGDYKIDVDNANTALECARACEADEGCLHWNFAVGTNRCDLKAEASGHDNSVAYCISGNAKRYISGAPKTPGEL